MGALVGMCCSGEATRGQICGHSAPLLASGPREHSDDKCPSLQSWAVALLQSSPCVCWRKPSPHLLISLSLVQLCSTLGHLWTVAHQAPLSTGTLRQEYWGGLPFPSPGDLLDPGREPASAALAGGFFTTEPPGSFCRGDLNASGLEVGGGGVICGGPCQALLSLRPNKLQPSL